MNMKRAYLSLLLLLVSGFAKAQGLYFTGHSAPDSSGMQNARVWLNYQPIFDHHNDSIDYKVESLFIDKNDEVYYCGQATHSDGTAQGILWRDGEEIFSAETGSLFNKVFKHESDIYTIGYTTGSTGKTVAAVWQNSELFCLPSTLKSSINTGIMTSDGSLFTAGYEMKDDTLKQAVIWNDCLPYLTLSDTLSAEILDMIIDGDDLYSAGYTIGEDGFRHAAIWKNDSLVFAIDSLESCVNTILAYHGDLYAAGNIGDMLTAWKNGQVFFEESAFGTSKLTAITVYRNTIYLAGQFVGRGTIWIDGYLYSSDDDCEIITCLQLKPECLSTTSTLPWHEDFDDDYSHWPCWESDGWDLTSTSYGTTCAHSISNDDAWLVTPAIYLQPNRDSTWIQFHSLAQSFSPSCQARLMISTTANDTASFSPIWSLGTATNEWSPVTIDLSEYQGQRIFLAFQHHGDGESEWFIDDIDINETFAIRDTTETFPFFEDFEEGISDWLIIDDDHLGNLDNFHLSGNGFEDSLCVSNEIACDTSARHDCLIISPPIALDRFMAYDLSFVNKNTFPDNAALTKVQIASVGSTLPEPYDFQDIWWSPASTTGWDTVSISLNDYTDDIVYIAFRHIVTSTVSKDTANSWQIDNIRITERPRQHDIEVEANVPEWGTVSGGGTYQYLDTIQITATPAEGYVFANWRHDDISSTSNPLTIVVTKDMTCTAFFDIRRCLVQTFVAPENAGVVEAAGFIEGAGTYDYGSEIMLMAQAAEGHQFVQWSDSITDNPRLITVYSDTLFTAEFRTLQYEITTEASPEDGGSVSGGGIYYYGEKAELSATPNEDYLFLCWSDGTASNPRQVTVTKDDHFTALFYNSTTPEYVITVLSDNIFLGTASGSGTYPQGATIQISATPTNLAKFVQWNDGNTDNPRHVTVTSDMTFTAYFDLIPTFTVSVISENPAMGTVMGGGTYQEGTIIEIGAFPREHFFFNGWQDGDMNNPRSITVTNDAEYIASFSTEPTPTFTLTIYYDYNQGFVLGAGTYEAGAIANIAAIPANGYEFVKWGDDNTENPREILIDRDIVLAAFFSNTSINEDGILPLAVYPNPANDKISIHGIDSENEISIYNIYGIKVKGERLYGDAEIGIDDLPAGFYIIQTGKRIGKFIKR